MAKEKEEKEGRAVAKKDTRKRRSKSNHNPDGSSNREDPKAKKKKLEHVVCLGYSSKMSERHQGELACLAALVTQKKTDLRATDNMKEIFEADTSNAGVYMEWSNVEETYFIHIHSRPKLALLKFELLGVTGSESVPEETGIKNPLLVFSEGFGEGGSGRRLRCCCVSKPDANCDKDYIYAFTRISCKIHLRIYKINSSPSADKEDSVKQVFAMFLLKPVEIQCGDKIDYFLDLDRFLMFQGGDSLTALSSVSTVNIQHLDFLGQFKTMLPGPPDLSEWEGFNTNITEYFSRFYAFKRTKIPGTGPERSPQFTMTFPEASYWHLCLPFKVFARSLIICVGDTFRGKACYLRVREKNIFLRGKTVKILGAGLTNYTLEKAVSNLNAVGLLLERLLMKMGLVKDNFPADLVEVLELLKRNPFKENIDLKKNPVQDYDLIKNNICWMDGEERNHVIFELFQDFLYRMGPYDQLDVGKPFPPFIQWVNMFDQHNYLLRICRHYSLPKNRKSQEALENWHEERRIKLLEFVNNKKAEADKLYSSREYFSNINNAIKHLLETIFKKDKLKLSPNEIDLIASSQFAATYSHVQTEVPKALARVDPNDRGSYKRFAKFFHPDDAIQFKQEDKK